MRRVIWITLLYVGFSACAFELLMPPGPLAARGREADPLRPHTIRTADRFFGASVPAKLTAPIERVEEAYLVRLDIGSAAPVECLVYRRGLDPASSLVRFAEASFEAIKSSQGEIDFKQLDEVDAGALGGSPYLYASWLYRIGPGDGDGFTVGEIKHLTTQKAGRTLHCVHNELGYRQTFRHVVSSLVKSAKFKHPLLARPYFTQISTLTLGGKPVGFELALLTRDAEGDTRIDVRTSLLMPSGRATLRTRDSFGVEFADPEGRLVNQVHVENVNGERVTDLALDPRSDGSWQISGTYQRRKISAELRPDRPPASWLGEAFALRRTLAKQGVGSEISLMRWMPSADPKRLVAVDASGSSAEGSVDLGFGQMAVERVYSNGRF